ncbi:MAG: ATP synthase subunit I [Clostridia bacterium]|nr:ATP synthase subunit I [Clostridia bacterium]
MKRKIDPVIRREAGYISIWLFGALLLTQAVFLLIGHWHYSVLLGSLLGCATALGNFLLLGHMIQRALTQDQKKAANTVRLSQGGRLLMQGVILVLAALLPCFNIWSAAIPLLIPRIAVSVHAKQNGTHPSQSPSEQDTDLEEDEDD